MTRVVRSINFTSPPKVGTILMCEGQRYEVVSLEPYVRKDGTTSILIVWQTWCAETGLPFTIKTGLAAKSVNRRCEKHAKPSKAVTAAGRNRLRKFFQKKHGRKHV